MSAAAPTRTKAKPQPKAKDESKQAEANRRNSKKSTGPRTAAGKDRSKFNAVTHGLTALSVLLPGEDSSQLAARQQQLIDSLQPRHAAELTAIERMAAAIWRSDRSTRAAGNRLMFRLRHEPLEQAKLEQDEAIELGGRLMWQPAFPLPISRRFPIGKLTEPQCAENAFHPHHPARLRLQLEQTIPGVEWLLDRWGELRRRLCGDDLWLSADAFKMVRLMGKHAIEMTDDLDVTRVFLASLTLLSAPKDGPERESFDWISALIKMLVTFDVENKRGLAAGAAKQCEPFARRLAELPLARLAPKDEEQARECLHLVIDDETRRLQEMMLMLRSIRNADLAEAPARLAFETGPEGDRYRRYELTNERLALQSYDRFLMTRNFVVTGRFDLIDVDLQTLIGSEPVHTKASAGINPADFGSGEWIVGIEESSAFEPNIVTSAVDDWQTSSRSPQWETGCDDEPILRNEANSSVVSGSLSVVCCPSPIVGDAVVSRDEPNAPNEPIAAGPGATNEPNVLAENATNEPIDAYENAPNEPKLATGGENGESAELSVHTNHEESLESQIDLEKAWAWVSQGVEGRKAARAESLRRLNEESQHEALAAQAIRHSFRGGHTSKNGKPGDQTNGQKEATDNAVEDQHGNEATDNEQWTVHKASGIGHVDEITDNGQRITDKTEIAGGELSEEQFRATRFALWQEQDARSRIALPN